MPVISDTAYPRLPTEPGAAELEAFTPEAAELAFARQRTRQPGPRLALLVLLKAFQRLGYAVRLADVSPALVSHVAASAGLGGAASEMSAIAAFAQGTVLGAIIQGFKVDGRNFGGGSFDWLTPFSVLTGVAVMLGYSLLGASWLIIKTEGALQAWARRMGRICFLGVLAAIAIVSIWTPIMQQAIAQRWFSWPDILYLVPIPIITLGIAVLTWRSLNRDGHAGPFVGAMGLFLMSYLGIVISLWPFVVPRHYTLWQAASDPSTQVFLLIGTLFLLPVIIMYTGWSYWVFRGKVRGDIGYH